MNSRMTKILVFGVIALGVGVLIRVFSTAETTVERQLSPEQERIRDQIMKENEEKGIVLGEFHGREDEEPAASTSPEATDAGEAAAASPASPEATDTAEGSPEGTEEGGTPDEAAVPGEGEASPTPASDEVAE